jgi:CubicO group peptidase (beta-lactamase class C family)
MKKLGILALVVLLAAAAFALYRSGDADADQIVVKLVPGPPQPKVSPGEAGIDPAAIQLAVDYAGKRNTSALVIGRNGHIVFEKYWGGTTLDTSVSTDRFAQVLVSLLVGSAMNDRLIRDLDEPVANYLPDLPETLATLPNGAVTLRVLLGSQFDHVDASREIIARILERVTKQPYETLVIERLWKPLGGGELSFHRGGAKVRGNAAVAICCVDARISDWMRVGELLANDGVFEGNQFTPPRFVTLMLTPTHKESPVGFGVNVGGEFAAADVAWLDGGRSQRLWVVPSLRLVILRVGDEPDASDGWDEAMIPDSIIRGTSGWHPKSVGEGVDPNKYAPH